MVATNLQVTNLAPGTKFIMDASNLAGGGLALQAVAVNNAAMGNTNVTTVGAATLSALALLSGLITRSGSTADYTDTTDTAALIQAAWGASTGSSFVFVINNTTAFNETLAGGTGVTFTGASIIPANSSGAFTATWTGANTISIATREINSNTSLPNTKFSTLNATTGSLPAGAVTGARKVVLQSTNAVPGAQLVRTAAQMLADIPNSAPGFSWEVRIVNTGAGVFTLTTDAGATVTLTGTMTIAQNTWREFLFTLVTPTTATVQQIGTGTTS